MADKIPSFLQEVQQYPFLYIYRNRCSTDFKRREEMWQELGDKYNLDDAKGKFKELRELFLRNKCKYDKTKTYPRWKYYPYLEFLNDYRNPRKSIKESEDNKYESDCSSSDESFSNIENEKLIALIRDVKSHPILYDNLVSANGSNGSSKLQNKIWMEMNRKYNFNSEHIFRGICDRYVREKQEIDLSNTMFNEHIVSQWKLYHHLVFLDEFLLTKKRKYEKTSQLTRRDDIEKYESKFYTMGRDLMQQNEESDQNESEQNDESDEAEFLSEFDMMLLFINEVKDNALLYDRNHRDYRNFKKKRKIWLDLSSKYSWNARVKFISLRDQYVREKKRTEEYITKFGQERKTLWKFYKYLQFLNPHINSLKSDQDFDIVENSDDDNSRIVEYLGHEKAIATNGYGHTDSIASEDIYEEQHIKRIDENVGKLTENTKEFPNFFQNEFANFTSSVQDDNDNNENDNDNDNDEDVSSFDDAMSEENSTDKLEHVLGNILLENKCGQIYFDNGGFLFQCDFCRALFKEINLYTNHVLSQHETLEMDFDNATNNLQHVLPVLQNTDLVNVLPNDLPNDFTNDLPNDLTNVLPNYLPNDLPSMLPVLQADLTNDMSNQLMNQFTNLPNDMTTLLTSQLNNDLANNVPEAVDTDAGKITFDENGMSEEIIVEEIVFGNDNCVTITGDELSNLEEFLIIPPMEMNHGDEKFDEEESEQTFDYQKISPEQSTTNFFQDSYHMKFNQELEQKLLSDKLKSNEQSEDNETKENVFACQLCSKTFANSEAFENHNGVYHLNVEKISLECKQCGQFFKSSAALKTHMNVHESKRPYKCQYCSADFTNPQYLDYHIRIHTNDRRYECDYCDKKFIRKFDKIFHERAMHTNEKPHQCHDCGKTFVASSQLLHHRRVVHLNQKIFYECDICGKKLTTNFALKMHKSVHNGPDRERKYKCTICSKEFSTINVLKTHEKTHSEDKKYVCLICNKSFSQNSGLYSHKKTHEQCLPFFNMDK